MINYIIQVILFQILFLAVYDFFLSKETFFIKNRWYLLSTPIVSFLLPLVKIPTFQKVVSQEYVVYLPEIVLSPEKVIQETSWYPSINYIDVLFSLGVVFFALLFITKLVKIILLIRSCKLDKKDGYTLVLIPNQTKAFSFFNYIFLGNNIPKSQKEQIIAHELVHSKQKHSLDLLLFEFLKIVMWFNPMIFIYQKRITLIHEYISDEVAAKSAPKENYINQLLSNFFQVENIAFINQFYKQTFIKKRIIMMTKNKSKKMNQLKYLLLIPVLGIMLFYTSCANKQESKEISASEKLLIQNQKIKEIELQNIILENKLLKDSIKKLKKEKFYVEKLSDYMKKKLFEEQKSNSKAFEDLGIVTKEERKEVSFMTIDKAPTFPSCDSGDKDCFHKMVQKHFVRNFDAEMPKKLGLSPGRKKVFIGFKVDYNGNVTDVVARAPHPKIKDEVIRVMNALPRMIPGEQDGKKVNVKYSIPFTLFVEDNTKNE
ncbi:BlaR1 peptidase M56 [Polaribacter aestuariivivens]|uniref:BlaR1 peptidase M56 n=1 Tax=Polaribacter aestuariivivens TaxID=2304626 RepID=A0A5S3NFG6_9FLAO|nr:M56 family metallopeptidase [Polaribacter aestuariivivens]TMM32186.1 BlaR1 peptidase M56 [Polaribacter aestuariivivens]